MSVKSREVIYEKHPVSAERKAELVAKGYRIVDAVYAPEDYEHPEKVKVPVVKRSEGLSVDQLKAELTAAGIDFKASASKPELAALLDAAEEKPEGEQE